MARTSDSITLGVGTLYINNVDVGYLSGGVTLTTETEAKEFKYGTHQTLVKRVVTTVGRSLKANLAQIDMDTLKIALGVGALTTVNSNQRLNFGANYTLSTLTNVKFVHEKDDGKKITVFFPKAQILPGSTSLEFNADDFLSQEITISAVEDLTRPDCPLGFIQDGETDDTSRPTIAITNEVVEADEDDHTYQLAHYPVLQSATLTVKSSDGNTTYTITTDYTVNYTTGVITRATSGSTITEDATLKVSYSY